MFCPNCGNRVEDGEEFCASCGTRIAGTPENEEYARNDAGEYDDVVTVRKTGHKRKRIKTILPVVLVIGIVAFAWVKKDSMSPLLEKMNQKIVSELPKKETKGGAEEDSGDWEQQINRKENWIDHSQYIDSSAQISSSDMETLEQFGENYINSRDWMMLPAEFNYESGEISITDINYVGSSFWKAQDNISNPWNIIFLYYEVTAATENTSKTYYVYVSIGNLEKTGEGHINLDDNRIEMTVLSANNRDTMEELQNSIQEIFGKYYSEN